MKIRLKNMPLFVALLMLLASCRQSVEPIDVQRLTQLSELGTVEYTVSKVIKAKDDQNVLALFGTRKILYTTTSTLKAGFDLSQMTDDDIKCNPITRRITLTLPAPKLLSLTMKPQDIHLLYHESTGLRRDFPPEIRNALLAQGERDIRNHVEELGIMEDAKTYGREYFETFLRQCGYETITINFKQQ